MEICDLSLDILCPAHHDVRWIKCKRPEIKKVLCPFAEEKRKNMEKFLLGGKQS